MKSPDTKAPDTKAIEARPIEAWFYDGHDPLIPTHSDPSISTEIVVASYTEDLKWCAMWELFNPMMNLIPSCKIRVYRTGPRNGDTLHLKNEVTYLENKGREGGQWLAHIVNNYDNLSDVTFFVQADLGVSQGGAQRWPIDLNLFKKFRFPYKGSSNCCGGHEAGPLDDYSVFSWPSFDRIRTSIQAAGMQEKHNYGIGPGPDIESGQHYETAKLLYQKTCPLKINFPAQGNFSGAQFMATRNLIRRKPKEYYEMCMNNIKRYELSHALEFGGWPGLVLDVFGNHTGL